MQALVLQAGRTAEVDSHKLSHRKFASVVTSLNLIKKKEKKAKEQREHQQYWVCTRLDLSDTWEQTAVTVLGCTARDSPDAASITYYLGNWPL